MQDLTPGRTKPAKIHLLVATALLAGCGSSSPAPGRLLDVRVGELNGY